MDRKAGLLVPGLASGLDALFLDAGATFLPDAEFAFFRVLAGEELPCPVLLPPVVALFFLADLRTAFLADPADFFTVFLLDDFLLPEAI